MEQPGFVGKGQRRAKPVRTWRQEVLRIDEMSSRPQESMLSCLSKMFFWACYYCLLSNLISQCELVAPKEGKSCGFPFSRPKADRAKRCYSALQKEVQMTAKEKVEMLFRSTEQGIMVEYQVESIASMQCSQPVTFVTKTLVSEYTSNT